MDRSITLRQSFTFSLSLSASPVNSIFAPPCLFNFFSSVFHPAPSIRLSFLPYSLWMSLGHLFLPFSFSTFHCFFHLPLYFRLIAACSEHKREVFHRRQIVCVCLCVCEEERKWCVHVSVQAGQEGAGHQHTGRVKKLQGWRSDQTGLRRSRAKLWGKLTGTNLF